MKKNDKINLDSISNIDEKIIDEVTDKKIVLTEKPAAARLSKKFIAIASIAASFVLLLSFMLVVLIPILSSAVPVYEGMTIRNDSAPLLDAANYDLSSNGITFLSAKSGTSIEFLDKSNGTPNGVANGHHKDRNDKLETDIEDIVTIEVVTDGEVKYYVKPGDKFIIEIHINNPKDYEIQSFTLNGDKYANYMFKEGSTMELLLLEVTAPSEPGYVEYTIDAIKYIDGTEIKDVDMSQGDKSIKVGIAYPAAPSAAVTSQSISSTSVELSVNVVDEYSLIGKNELLICLSDGENIIKSIPLTVGENNISFDNLAMIKTYEYGIVTSFDMADGRDLHKEWLLTNTITTASAFGISNAAPTQDSISFEINKTGELGEITSISLYDTETDELVEAGGADTREFKSLLTNHSYDLYVDFKYTSGGKELADWVAIKGIKTMAKTAPTFTFSETSSDKTSISYSVEVTDTENLLSITKVELLKYGEAVKDNGTALVGTFDALLSNNTYDIRVTYTYDLNDGQGVVTKNITKKDITTVAMTMPTLTFGEINATDISVTGKVNIADPDLIGKKTSVDIFKGETLIQSNAQKVINFSALESHTEYKIVATHTFDMNDGIGLRTISISCDIKTAPHLEFMSCKIINTDTVKDGDKIYMQVELDNPSGALLSSVVVNGQEYNCSASTTSNKIFVEIVNNGQFEDGEVTLTLEKVNMTLDGKDYSVSAVQNNSDSVFISVKLEKLKVIESLGLVVSENGEYINKDYIYPSDTAYLMLSLMNESFYSVDSITIQPYGEEGEHNTYMAIGDPITVQDPAILANGDYLIAVSPTTFGNIGYNITLTYKSIDGTETASSSASTKKVYRVISDEIKEISTPDDLLNMNEGYHYKQTADIDLDGISWTGAEFNGVFDGCGHSITNMTRVGTVSGNAGLFMSGHGIIKNVHLKKVTFIVDGSSNAGALLGAGRITIDNCHVDSDSVIIATGNVGGIVGYLDLGGSSVTNCTNSAAVSGGSSVGGIAGVGNGDIINCTNYGNISSNERAGGIAGSVSATGYVIENCENYGKINGNTDADGILADSFE